MEGCQPLNDRFERTDFHQPCASLADQFQQRGHLPESVECDDVPGAEFGPDYMVDIECPFYARRVIGPG